MTDGVQQAKAGDLGTKVKALVWEECRTGGAIAGVCLSVGVFQLLWFRLWVGPLMISRDPYFIFLTILGVPMATALLLILNPDYSGHLAGGFSSRVLRLPVPTSIAVAVALAARTVFVFLVALTIITLAHAILEDPPGWNIILLITLFYLVAQLLDWLRAPISGLSSLLVLVLIGVGILFVSLGGLSARDAQEAMSAPWMSPLLLFLLAPVTYGVSLVAVHAARVGRRVGVPEIWEWPQRVSINWPGRRKPFSSAMGGQVWYELRRVVWSLPGATLLIWLVLVGMAWIIAERSTSWDGSSTIRLSASFFLFGALLLAAAVQGLCTSILGIRRAIGKPGYDQLLPLTDHQFACARVYANALVLAPILLLVVVFHFVLGGQFYISHVIYDALAIGTASWHEVVWTLVSRGLLIGIAAWAFLAIGTRLVVLSMVLFGVLSFVNDFLSRWIPSWGYADDVFQVLYVVYLIGVTLVMYAYAWKQGLAPGRTVAIWAGIWGLLTWLLHYTVATSWPTGEAPILAHLGGLASAMGIAALVPLVYVAVLVDVRRRRHSAAPSQDPAQHGQAPGVAEWVRARPLVALGTGCAVLLAVWLGWPGAARVRSAVEKQGISCDPC